MSIPTLRPYQSELEIDIHVAFELTADRVLLVLPTGGGKCLGRGTPVLRFDGTVVPVEDILAGDILMGPDSKPRRVKSTTTGQEELFRVTSVKGDSYVVNRSHILSLKMTGLKGNAYCGGRPFMAGDICNVGVEDYIQANRSFKHCAKTWRTGVEFPPQTTPEILPPYILGVWLGDGDSKGPTFSNPDPEVISEIKQFAERQGLRLRAELADERCPRFHLHMGVKGGVNPLLNALREVGLLKNKHIPQTYLSNSRDARLELLAGLMDTDGYLHHNGYDFVSVSERLADGVCFLARSCGMAAYKTPCRKECTNTGVWGDYYRVSISGDTQQIPCRVERKRASERKQKKSALVTGVQSVESIGEGDYFGFEIEAPDGATHGWERLFLLGDFTVTHNTMLLAKVVFEESDGVWVVAHRQELLKQISDTLSRFGVDHGMVKSGFPFQPEKRVQVASMQTLVRRAAGMPKPRLIVLDEAHHCLCASVLKILATASQARVLGVTATPCRLNGSGLGEVFEHMIIGPTNKWLTGQGFLSPAMYYAPPPKADIASLPVRGGDYAKEAAERAMDKPYVTGDAVEHYREICDGVPMLVFCVSVEHAKHVAAAYVEAGYRAASVDGSLDDETRNDRITGLANGKYQVITSCDLIGEGLDVPVVGAVQLLRPTESLALHLQQIGRGLRPSEGKKHTYVLDHVGNVVKHRFASTEHPWTLTGKVRSKKEKAETIRTCGECFMAHETAKVCPFCNYVYPIKSKSLTKMEVVDGKLVRLEETAEDRAEEMRNARTMPELIAFAKSRGYKKPQWWARKVYGGRNYSHYMPSL